MVVLDTRRDRTTWGEVGIVVSHWQRIERLCGMFPNPEELAQMRDGLPAKPLYRVRFAQKDVWPDYIGNPSDVLEIEIFQHWLEKA